MQPDFPNQETRNFAVMVTSASERHFFLAMPAQETATTNMGAILDEMALLQLFRTIHFERCLEIRQNHHEYDTSIT